MPCTRDKRLAAAAPSLPLPALHPQRGEVEHQIWLWSPGALIALRGETLRLSILNRCTGLHAGYTTCGVAAPRVAASFPLHLANCRGRCCWTSRVWVWGSWLDIAAGAVGWPTAVGLHHPLCPFTCTCKRQQGYWGCGAGG